MLTIVMIMMMIICIVNSTSNNNDNNDNYNDNEYDASYYYYYYDYDDTAHNPQPIPITIPSALQEHQQQVELNRLKLQKQKDELMQKQEELHQQQHLLREEAYAKARLKQKEEDAMRLRQKEEQKNMASRGFLVTGEGLKKISKKFSLIPRVYDGMHTQYGCLKAGHDQGSRPKDSEEMQLLTIIEEKKKQDEIKQRSMTKLSLKERQEERMRYQMEMALLQEKMKKDRKFFLGTTCEMLACTACMVVVEEFAIAVKNAMFSPEIKYVEQVFEGFCENNDIKRIHGGLVERMCKDFFGHQIGYKEALFIPFETHKNWESPLPLISTLFTNKNRTCGDIGACDYQMFTMNTTKVYRYQERWDDKCFVCQKFADDLEARVTLSENINEGTITTLVNNACERLGLTDTYYDICKSMIKGKSDTLSWLADMHKEKVKKKVKADIRFSDFICQDLNYCLKWESDGEIARKNQVIVEPVFS